jgi:hypothetical protein
VLRVDQLGLARAVAEERGVEEIDAVDDEAGLDVAGLPVQRGIDTACLELLVGEMGDRFDPVAQVPPEGVHVGGARQAAGHTHHGDLGSFQLIQQLRSVHTQPRENEKPSPA